MAFSTANAPYAVVQGPAGGFITTSTAVKSGPGNVWVMRTTDAVASWGSSSTAYIQTDVNPYGMKVYDPVWVVETNSTLAAWGQVIGISTSTATYGYATLIIVSTSNIS